jgi:hypothetical protein
MSWLAILVFPSVEDKPWTALLSVAANLGKKENWLGRSPAPPTRYLAIRITLQIAERVRDLTLFDLAIDSKLRACDLPS